MTIPPLYSNNLTLSPSAKSIPYAGDRITQLSEQPQGSINYGFRNLKLKPSLIRTIPELFDDRSLRAIIKNLNQPETCFFTVGCASQLLTHSSSRNSDNGKLQGYKRQGYLEISWNCAGCIQDAINYFALYFHFQKYLRDNGFNQPVDLKWVIEEASFSEVGIDGFSCSIHLETRLMSSTEQAEQVWQLSLKTIDGYFRSVHNQTSTPIYDPLSV